MHYSWNDEDKQEDLLKQIKLNQESINKTNFPVYYQDDLVPVYNCDKLDLNNIFLSKDIYDNFFINSGAIIVKNVYTNKLMEEYNSWCEDMLEISKNDGNSIHPKQKDKFLINDVIGRMSLNNPNLLINLLGNKYFSFFIDVLLGFAKIGSCTTHWINPGGDRQKSHVDYPIHVGSGAFWENSVDKLKAVTTNYQLNKILPFYSVQVLVASDKMDKSNGSTEIIPGSHKIDNLDILLHDKEKYNSIENLFINAKLEKGDILIFNRRLCHRGGKNLSNKRRNSLIMQCVWLWGVGQEIIDSSKVIEKLEKSNNIKELSDKQKNDLFLRLYPPYPIDVKNKT